MKKKYVKPMIVIESFHLDAAIAGSCSDDAGEIAINHYADSCGYGNPSEAGFTFEFFADQVCVNDLTLLGGDSNDGVCYHGPDTSGGITFVWS